jgi:Na+-translocating ferredoxin:NAD+ oxidoreductase RNF subunit RnfB
MNVTAIIIAALVVGAVGIILGFFLGISGEKFKVEVDPREEAILEVLPGNNCGGCGYAGCSGLAAAIAKGEAPATKSSWQPMPDARVNLSSATSTTTRAVPLLSCACG